MMNRKKRSAERKVIFLHIPKTGGTTVDRILNRKFEKKRIYTIDSANVRKSIKEFQRWPAGKRSGIALLKGHMPFGLHRYLGNNTVYFTLMREPVDRIVSYYYYMIQSPDHYLYKTVMAAKMSLAEFSRSEMTTELDNHQVRCISGVGDDLSFGSCHAELLDQAKENINQHFAFVGLTERFNASLLRIWRKLDWGGHPFYHKLNVTMTRPQVKDIPLKTIKKIQAYNELDCALYQWVEKNYAERSITNKIRTAFDLMAFLPLNRYYQRAVPPAT